MNSEIYQLIVIGINHKTSTISEREVFQITKKEISSALNYFKSSNEINGAIIVSTCNRLEFYLTLKGNADGLSIIKDFYHKKGIEVAEEKENLFYTYRGIGAARHLFKVVSGLDSVLIGEYQIQGQVKDAYSIACSEKTTDKVLHKLFHSAFHTGKEVRTKTKIGSGNQSLSGIAFNIMKEKLNTEDGITIIGVNRNTEIVAENLYKVGFKHLNFVNRTFYEAEKLADNFSGRAFSLENVKEALANTTCIFSCTGSPGFIIASGLINVIYNKMKAPRLIIDMAIPHDIETKGITNEIELIDLDSLQKYLEKQQKDISSDISEAIKIISDEARIFEAWKESQYNHKVCLFEERIEAIRLQLLDEIREKISDEELERMEKFSHSLIHRLKSTINESIRTNLPAVDNSVRSKKVNCLENSLEVK